MLTCLTQRHTHRAGSFHLYRAIFCLIFNLCDNSDLWAQALHAFYYICYIYSQVLLNLNGYKVVVRKIKQFWFQFSEVPVPCCRGQSVSGASLSSPYSHIYYFGFLFGNMTAYCFFGFFLPAFHNVCPSSVVWIGCDVHLSCLGAQPAQPLNPKPGMVFASLPIGKAPNALSAMSMASEEENSVARDRNELALDLQALRWHVHPETVRQGDCAAPRS